MIYEFVINIFHCSPMEVITIGYIHTYVHTYVRTYIHTYIYTSRQADIYANINPHRDSCALEIHTNIITWLDCIYSYVEKFNICYFCIIYTRLRGLDGNKIKTISKKNLVILENVQLQHL